jgi:hypothetical protein
VKNVQFANVTTVPLRERQSKVALAQFARAPSRGRSFVEFLSSLPHLQAASDLKSVVSAVVAARRAGRPVVFGLGAHVIKCGLNPIIIELMKLGVITGVALNGAGAIHDVELALVGATSEDVASGLKDGTFGMVRETGEFVNGAANRVFDQPNKGMGELLGQRLNELGRDARSSSILAAGHDLGIPVTVHVAVGTDIVHVHPSANGAAIGQASFDDFRKFVAVIMELSGGVYLNVGSAVILPEVFLKAFSAAQNLGANLSNYITVNIDMISHYRPGENVVRRPSAVGGVGYTLIGRHEIMVPLLAQAIVEELP